VAFTVAFCSIMTFIIIKVIDVVLGLRVAADEEEAGLDIAVQGETASVPWSGVPSSAMVTEGTKAAGSTTADARTPSPMPG
jgi:hypothetical protein